MKKAAVCVSLLMCVIAETREADADGTVTQAPTVTPTTVSKTFLVTKMTGSINVAASNPIFPLWGCDNIVATAWSTKSHSGDPMIPAWVRSKPATGTWTSGKCTYSLSVPPNEAFTFFLQPTTNDTSCAYISKIAFTPSSVTSVTLTRGQTKTQDFVSKNAPECLQ